MKRPVEHQLEEESLNYVNTTLPTPWIKRRQFPDYGEDVHVQVVTSQNEVTGDYLSVQVKAGARLRHVGGSVKITVEVKELEYLLRLRMPAILIAYESRSRSGWWLFVQEYVYENLGRTKPNWKSQKTVTIEMAEECTVPDGIDALARIARDGPMYLVRKGLSLPSDWMRSLRLTGERSDLAQMVSELQRRKEEDHAMRIQMGFLDSKIGPTQQGYDALVQVFTETKESNPDLYAQAAAGLLSYYNPVDKDDNKTLVGLAATGAAAASRAGNTRLEAFLSAALGEFVHLRLTQRVGHVLLAKKYAEASSLGWTTVFLQAALEEINEKMTQVAKYFQRGLDLAVQSKDGYTMAIVGISAAEAHINLYTALSPFVSRADLMEIKGNAQRILDFVKLLSTDDPESSAHHMKAAGRLKYFSGDPEGAIHSYEIARAHAERAKLSGMVDSLKHLEELTRQRPDPLVTEPRGADEISPDEERAAALMMLDAWGVDLTKKDLISNAARIGLDDLNPERIFKWCDHLHAQGTGVSFLGRQLGLPIGMKVLYCAHGGIVAALSLDGALETFKASYCNGCAFHSPRPSDWKWSHKWSRERGIPPEMQKAIDGLS